MTTDTEYENLSSRLADVEAEILMIEGQKGNSDRLFALYGEREDLEHRIRVLEQEAEFGYEF